MPFSFKPQEVLAVIIDSTITSIAISHGALPNNPRIFVNFTTTKTQTRNQHKTIKTQPIKVYYVLKYGNI